MLATTGMRRGECLGLRWSDVDLTAGRASIVQTVIAISHAVRFGSPKTAHGRRTVTLDVYSHVTEGLHSDAASRVAGIIFGTGVSTR